MMGAAGSDAPLQNRQRLGTDVQRFLADETVSARLWARLIDFSGAPNKLLFAAVATIAALLVTA
jgi:hypothetical protein